ncbi:DUF2007 domain-containing protein [Bradymonas sediminis]|uniref:Uncharacterized protein n=1 Tax=Bradymonas sediminis TaxID=1548548 RepID=A0A2Z4FQH2_9DELT|nr:DUF2007 domain-containing protein [Bradymonas sediminis]AWV91277.1 hypothetical protein DN745_18885 [Bradymonas sediminis]TDP73849.1 putative signal transducing protein [Bradymonas sediminis]
MTEPTRSTDDHARRAQSNESGSFQLVDVYVSYNPVEAEMIREILVDNEIECFVRSLAPSQFPLSVGKHGENRVTVPADSVDAATAILRQAIAEGALSGEGRFGV